MAYGVKRAGVSAGLPVSASRIAGLGPGPASAPAVGGGLELITVGFGQDSRQSNAAGADGVCDALFDTVPPGHMWLIERINVTNTSTAAAAATAYVGAPVPQNQADLSPNGTGDVADEIQPIRVQGGTAFRIRWTGCTLGAVGTVAIQYRDVVTVGR